MATADDTHAGQAEAAVDPQKPKKALSAYWLFSNEVREATTKELKDKNEGKAKLGDVAKEIARRWAALPEAERSAFEDKAAADKQRYAKEFAAYLEASDPAGTLRKKHADMIPKKPQTAYFSFCQDAGAREKAAEALKAAGQAEPTPKQVTAKLSELWKAAGADEKAPFEERHRKEQAEFWEKQKAWQATPEFAEIERAEKEQEEKRRASGAAGQEDGEGKGKKRGRSAPAGRDQETPKPKGKKAKQASPVDKQAKKADAKKGAAPVAEIDEKVLAEAAKKGLESSLRNLAGRTEIISSGKKAGELLKALQASGGLVNPAKRALLGD